MIPTWQRLPLALAATATLLCAAPQAPAPKKVDAHRTTWELANFTWVKLLPREAKSSPNAHPATISTETLLTFLGSVRFKQEEAGEALFESSELKGLVKALGEAFATADADEDVVLLSAHRRSAGFMSPQLGATARLFVKDGQLNLLAHDARLDFVTRYMAEGVKPKFQFGSRTEPAALTLASPLAAAPRADWLTFPLAAPAAPAAQVAVQVQALAPAPTAAPRSEAWFREREEKLRSLKRLRDENLLTEAEYQQKRQEILKDY